MIIFIVDGEFAIKVNKDALLQYKRLKQNDLFSTIKRNTIPQGAISVFFHNTRSLSKYRDDIVSDDGIINNDIIGFTYTSDCTCKIFNINFKNNENKFFKFSLQIQKRCCCFR